ATGQTGKRLPGGIGVNGGEASTVAGVEALQQIESLFPSDFSQDGTLGPVAQTGLEQIADGDGRKPRPLLAAVLEAHKVRLADMDFGSVFDDQQPVFVGNEV